jgi:uncharacterized membrane protein YeaQ/YmgE (transglycosylase-associated protein family)
MIILYFIVFGMFAGWLADLILRGRATRAQHLVAGLVGSFIGGTVASLIAGDGLRIRPSGLLGAIAGAIVVLAIWERRPA